MRWSTALDFRVGGHTLGSSCFVKGHDFRCAENRTKCPGASAPGGSSDNFRFGGSSPGTRIAAHFSVNFSKSWNAANPNNTITQRTGKMKSIISHASAILPTIVRILLFFLIFLLIRNRTLISSSFPVSRYHSRTGVWPTSPIFQSPRRWVPMFRFWDWESC